MWACVWGPGGMLGSGSMARRSMPQSPPTQPPTLPTAPNNTCRCHIHADLVAPVELVKQLAVAAAAAGLVPAAAAEAWVSEAAADGGLSGGSADDEEDGGAAAAMRWPAVWAAVCRVWASKWTDR